jgi:hypothetical protein
LLPIFFEGLRETEDPMCFLADKGIDDLLKADMNKILAVIP